MSIIDYISPKYMFLVLFWGNMRIACRPVGPLVASDSFVNVVFFLLLFQSP